MDLKLEALAEALFNNMGIKFDEHDIKLAKFYFNLHAEEVLKKYEEERTNYD